MSYRARLVGGVAGVAAGDLAAIATRAAAPTDAISRFAADRMPLAVVELAVFRLHRRDKTALRLSAAATLASLAAVAIGEGRSRGAKLRGATLAAGLFALAQRRPPRAPARAMLAAATQVLTGVAVARSAGRHPAGAVAVTVAAAGAATFARAQRQRCDAAASPAASLPAAPTLPADGAGAWAGATPLVTPLELFHVTDINFGAPDVRLDTWSLRVTGAVGRPVDLDWGGLLALGTVDIDAVLVCIHNRVGWERAANARWHGVPFAVLRDFVGAEPSASHVLTRAADGFTIAVPVADLEGAGLTPYIVVGMNGHTLPAAHGFPARFFVPGVYGQFAGAKWLTEIQFTNRYVPGDWERRGWLHEPVWVRPHARIDGTRQEADALVVTGVAWAPPHGVAAVEVSVDGGPWAAAELAGEVAPIAWRRWRSRQVLARGHHRIRARAVRSDGEIQDGKPRPPFPTGVSGYQEVSAVAGEDAHR